MAYYKYISPLIYPLYALTLNPKPNIVPYQPSHPPTRNFL